MKIFISAPISGFESDEQYNCFRMSTLAFIRKLATKHIVVSELSKISNSNQYGSPEASAKSDFHNINDADMFLFIHPKRMQTSSLIELGYAYALCKPIVIVASISDLPYLSLGLGIENHILFIVEGSIDNDTTREQVVNVIDNF